jgi:hypothetical protein
MKTKTLVDGKLKSSFFNPSLTPFIFSNADKRSRILNLIGCETWPINYACRFTILHSVFQYGRCIHRYYERLYYYNDCTMYIKFLKKLST